MPYADPKKKTAQLRKWRKDHPEYQRGKDAKERGLDFIAVNKPFENAVGHHIDEHFVVYVPKELHDSIRHSIKTGRNMKKMNAKVFEWLIREDNTP